MGDCEIKYSEELEEIFKSSFLLAMRNQHSELLVEHIVYNIIDNQDIAEKLRESGLNVIELSSGLDAFFNTYEKRPPLTLLQKFKSLFFGDPFPESSYPGWFVAERIDTWPPKTDYSGSSYSYSLPDLLYRQ